MAIELASKYSKKVDELFTTASKTNDIVNQDYDFIGVNSVKVYSVGTAAMGDYTRSGTSRYGTPAELDATTQEMILSKDRSFTYTIDKRNKDETQMVLDASTSLNRQIREIVIPEIDKYRLDAMATNAGTSKTLALTKDNIYDEITTATVALDDAEVPVDGRVLIVTPTTYQLMKQSSDIILNTEISNEQRTRGIIANLDGMEVRRVPSNRIGTANFGFMITHRVATVSPIMLSEYKIHQDAPGISGALVEGRIVYDAFILDNKAKAIYLHLIA